MKIELGFALSTNKFPFNLFALLINWLQKIDASHTYLAYYAETESKKYFDSTFWTVRDLIKKTFLKSYEIKKSYYLVAQIERSDFLKWMEKHEGKNYSMIQVIGLLLMICGFSKRNILRGDPTKMICNELALDFCVEFLDLKLEKNINDYDLDETLEIFELLVNQGKLHRGEI